MRLCGAFGVVTLWVAALCPGTAWAAPVRFAYDELVNLNASLRDQTGEARGKAVVQRYRELTAKTDLCSGNAVTPARADDLFRATAFAELYSLAADDVAGLGCLYGQLVEQGAVTDWHRKTYAGALITVARYTDAAELLGNSTSLPSLEAATAAAGPGRYITIDSPARARVEEWAPAGDQLNVVAVVHPACAFSVRALTQIDADPALAWLKQRLTLVVPPDATLPVSGLLTWREAHPQLPMHVMYLREDWRQLGSIDTPTFYLMRGERVISSFEGWPNADGVRALRAALEADATQTAPSPAPGRRKAARPGQGVRGLSH